MRILFVHQNFPGQFVHLAPALAARGHDVRALSVHGASAQIFTHLYASPARVGGEPHGWCADFDNKVRQGEACARAAAVLAASGWRPDLIIGHPGWGEMLFLRDIWPQAPQLHYLEFFYGAYGRDVGFDPEFGPVSWRDNARLRARNAAALLSLESMDAGLSPTAWQRSTFPLSAQHCVQVIHDGVDTFRLRPDSAAALALGGGAILRPGMEIVTFANRNLEPYRGYHSFMRALPRLLQLRPQALVLIVGGDEVSYGRKPPAGQSWKSIFLEEVAEQIDLSRVFFLGALDYANFVRLLQVSAVHVYLTYPFVLGWSMLEAMSCGALLVGSRTPPVEEIISHGVNGMLVDFFDADALAGTVAAVLDRPRRFDALRQSARDTIIQRYDLQAVCLPRQLALVEHVAGRPV